MARRAKFLGILLLLLTASTLCADFPGLGSNVTGTWVVKISTLTGRILGVAELTQNGTQVTGWFEPNGGDRISLSGALVLGKLVITTNPEPRHLVAFERCELNAGGNHMKGKFYPGNGKIEFMKQREATVPTRPGKWHPFGGNPVR
jgi:hypothetical protein